MGCALHKLYELYKKNNAEVDRKWRIHENIWYPFKVLKSNTNQTFLLKWIYFFYFRKKPICVEIRAAEKNITNENKETPLWAFTVKMELKSNNISAIWVLVNTHSSISLFSLVIFFFWLRFSSYQIVIRPTFSKASSAHNRYGGGQPRLIFTLVSEYYRPEILEKNWGHSPVKRKSQSACKYTSDVFFLKNFAFSHILCFK